jgi:hypothetical protein
MNSREGFAMAPREFDMVIELLQQVMMLVEWSDCPDMDRRDAMIKTVANHALDTLEQKQSEKG